MQERFYNHSRQHYSPTHTHKKKPNVEPEGSFGLQKSPVLENMYIFYAPDPSMLSFDVEVWAASDPATNEVPFLIGKAVVLPFKFKYSRCGHIRLPLLNNGTLSHSHSSFPNRCCGCCLYVV